ncbi:hypothetical protein N9Y23_04600 [Pseudomonadales bacterium]|nr:hypothetical protein [Pseudomonadales bacterium]
MSKVSIGDEVFETTDLLAHQQFNLWLFELVLPDVDLVIELLDARLPVSSQNPTIAALRGNWL